MSDRFRDLEKPADERRKDVVLMAAVSSFEDLNHPGRQDLKQFSRLFLPLFAAASSEGKRTASAALSRMNAVPDDVAEMIVNQPISVAAPFIAHYRNLPEAALARAIGRHGASHARAAARRPDLSAAGIAALAALNEPSVDRVLKLHGLAPQDMRASSQDRLPDVFEISEEELADAMSAELAVGNEITAPSIDPSDALREQLRDMVLRNPNGDAARGASLASRPRRRAPGARTADITGHARQFERFSKPGQAIWFTTALADAIGSSFELAERIMLDISGQQLATTMIALGIDKTIIKQALEAHFPHLSAPSQIATRANDVIAIAAQSDCAARLSAWQRADSYTSRSPIHVPVLAETGKDRGRQQDSRSATGNRHPAETGVDRGSGMTAKKRPA